jgi:hypothetical protein
VLSTYHGWNLPQHKLQQYEHLWADGVGQWYGSEVGQSPVVPEEGCLERWKLKSKRNWDLLLCNGTILKRCLT